MPANLTNHIIFNKKELNTEIQKALIDLQKILLKSFNLKEQDLPIGKITVKLFRNQNSYRIPKISEEILGALKNYVLDEEFIIELFKMNQLEASDVRTISKNIHEKYKFNFFYTDVYSPIYDQVFSSLLLLLHFRKIIHLPYVFKIPHRCENSEQGRIRTDYLFNEYPDILKACRLVDLNEHNDENSRFLSVPDKTKILHYGHKLILSLGWFDFNDVNMQDLLDFRNEQYNADVKKVPPYSIFINFLSLTFPNDFNIDLKKWINATKILNKSQKTKKRITKISSSLFDNDFQIEEIDLDTFDVDNLYLLKTKIDGLSETIDVWENIQKCYLNKTRNENIKGIKQSLKNLNMYLFLVLYIWFKNNKTDYKYPKLPKDLKGSIFISKLMKSKHKMPVTLTDFLQLRYESGKINKDYHYSILKNISSFFNFIELYADDLEGCEGFKNPINEFDYPKLTRSLGTNKGLIPRNLFGMLISYIEMIKTYNKVVFEKIINSELSYGDIESSFINSDKNRINTIKLQNKVGLIPLLYWNNQMVVFKEIPNLLDIKSIKFKNKPAAKLPHPHTLNHVYVTLQTGIRGNHIQWLDAEKFNSFDTDKKTLFNKLYVNTDKAKNSAWSPIVHRKVLDTLVEQLEWRTMVDNPKFHEEKYYNNNDKTKWPKFYPLFSYETDGTPYSDHAYKNCWLSVLINFQNIIELFNIKKVELVKLLPPTIKINDFDMQYRLNEYGSKCEYKCDLRWTTDITPHSARVSVVSHYITALPAEFIGKYITGQTEAVVHYYAKLDPNYIADLEKGQKEGLAKIAFQKEYEKLNGTSPQKTILTDKENSNLMQSLKIDKKETIVQYGCISINMKEEGKTGIDILLENSNIKLAFNKTEICPYNNNCPADIIKELKGLRKCGVCPFAIRTIDHLPAIAVKKRQVMETLEEIELKLENIKDESIEELNRMEDVRQEITEELLGWIMSEEMLEANRKSLESKETYIVKRPEILIDRLQQVKVKEGDVEYLLTRINDNESFPQLDSPLIKAKIDLLRRSLLAKLGNFKESFDSRIPSNPAFECLGLLREVIKRYDLTKENVVDLLSQDQLSLIQQNPLLGISYDRN